MKFLKSNNQKINIMGFSKSFFNQLGRDTGRAVSNALYKDRHAIVYRRVGDKSKQEAAKTELKLTEQKLELERELRQQERQEARLNRLSGKIEQKIEQIHSLEIPEDKPALLHTLNELIYLLKANSWDSTRDSEAEDALVNRYADTILAKYEHALITLGTYFPEDPSLTYYSQQLKTFRKNRFWGKYKMFVIGILVILGSPLFFYIIHLLDK
ncbi:hypothetical protein [Butyricimonas synergistica]|uniref:hypothetical protein n=1 Tax=Butyricimonas synergistica TaxID=544644 RepID=UPI00036383C7|nr:hypothetical protein [Butyricimonas synergistica]